MRFALIKDNKVESIVESENCNIEDIKFIFQNYSCILEIQERETA